MRWAAAAIASYASFASAPAAAQVEGPGWAFGEPGGEAALAVASGASLATLALPQRENDWMPYPVRPHHEGYAIASDFVGGPIGTGLHLITGWALEATYYESESAIDPYERATRSALVEGEAALLATGVTMTVKRIVGRCRPRAWNGQRCLDQYDAFPSGHTAPVASLAGARFVLAIRSDALPAHRFVSFGIAEGASLVTGLFRVLAGAHSIEDVVVGWAIGHAVGVGVALAHPMEAVPVRSDPAATPLDTPTGIGFGWPF